MPKEYITRSVSFPDEQLLEAAQAKAKADRRSFSNYVCGLIEDDLIQSGIMDNAGRFKASQLNEVSKKVSSKAAKLGQEIVEEGLEKVTGRKARS